MISATSQASSGAFATSDAGFDYFASDSHYQSLAGRILAAFRNERSYVLVTKDALTNTDTLAKALARKAGLRYSVAFVACRPEMTCAELLRSPGPRGPVAVRAKGQAETNLAARQPAPLYVLDDADRLTYEQVEEIYDILRLDEQGSPAVVLVAQDGFLPRLERPALRFLKDALAAQCPFVQLGRDEVGPFIAQQLRAAGASKAFPAETVAAIADVAGGNPGVVNRLARLVLDAAPSAAAAASAATPPEKAAEAQTPPESPAKSRTPEGRHAGSGLEVIEGSRQGAKPAELTPQPPAAIRSRSDSIIEAFADVPRGAEAGPEPPPPRSRRLAALRVPVGILVALAYVGVVSMASIAVFWIFHPSTPSFVSSGPRDIGMALDLLLQKLSLGGHKEAATVPAPVSPTATDTAASRPAEPASPAEAPSQAAPATATSNRSASSAPAPAPGSSSPTSDRSDAATPPPVPQVKPQVKTTTQSAAPPSPAPAPAVVVQPLAPLPEAAPAVGPAAEAVPSVAARAVATPTASPPASDFAAPTATAPTPTAAAPAPTAAVPAPSAALKTAPAEPAPSNPAASTTTTVETLADTEITALLDRGDALVAVGDIVSARLFYERAATAGNARAALLEGQTFDPAYLSRIGVRGVRGDPDQAATWYRRARDLGDPSAESRLNNLVTK
ncbi:MAG TPA: hypothetical protein VN832_04755 [Stellaceae bacterium]|nr:hypothetical protein [Stellaceae bacterium]